MDCVGKWREISSNPSPMKVTMEYCYLNERCCTRSSYAYAVSPYRAVQIQKIKYILT